MKKSNLDNFIPEDGNYLKRWDLYEPLFDNFYILGPKVFNSSCEPTCLYQYPLKFQKIKNKTNKQNDNSITHGKDKSEIDIKTKTSKISDADEKSHIIIDNSGDQLTQFFFPDGIHFIENDQSCLSTDWTIADSFSKPPEVYDHIIFIKSDGSIPHYYFCLRFRCSPYSRPAVFSLKEIEELTNHFNDINEDQICMTDEVKIHYLEEMKKYFINDIIMHQTAEICPTCLFAFCFETQHPFHDLYFKLIKDIVFIESSERSIALNLHSLLDVSAFHQPLIKVPSPRPKQKADDFILIDKIDNSSFSDSSGIISIKEISESSNGNNNNHNFENIQNNNESDSTQNSSKNSSIIVSDSFNENEDQNKSNQDSESPRNLSFRKSSNSSNIFGSSSSFNSNSSYLLNVEKAEKIYCNENDTNFSWPENAFNSRENFLRILYSEIVLPAIGEEMALMINRSILSKYIWRRPTIEQYCMSLSMYGIKPLLEWITLTDFIHLLSCIFLEYNIIVSGTEVEPIVRVVTSFPHIIFPFAWIFTILTIVPDSCLDILDSPIPFIAGVFKREKSINKIIQLADVNNILIIDMDDRRITWPKNSHPNIACSEIYFDSLKKFCSQQKNLIKSPEKAQTQSNIIFIHDDDSNRNRKVLKISKSSFNINKKKNPFYFNIEKVTEIVKTIMKNNHDIFTSKIMPAIVTRVKKDDIDHQRSGAISSMMVDELYLSQFPDKKNNWPFIERFMKTQMFITYRELSCRLKSDDIVDVMHVNPVALDTSSNIKTESAAIMTGYYLDNI